MEIFLIELTHTLQMVKAEDEFSVLLVLASLQNWRQVMTSASFMVSSLGFQNLQSLVFAFLLSSASPSQHLCLVPPLR